MMYQSVCKFGVGEEVEGKMAFTFGPPAPMDLDGRFYPCEARNRSTEAHSKSHPEPAEGESRPPPNLKSKGPARKSSGLFYGAGEFICTRKVNISYNFNKIHSSETLRLD